MPETVKQSRTYVKNPLLHIILADHRRCPPFLQPDFLQFHRSSRSSRYCQKTQLPDSAKYFPKKRLRHSHFCHLKYHVARMPDHLGSDLDQLLTQPSQRPLFQRFRQRFLDDRERTLWAKSFIVTKGRRLKLGDTHPHTQQSLSNLIALYDAWNKPGKADEWRAKLPQAENTMK